MFYRVQLYKYCISTILFVLTVTSFVPDNFDPVRVLRQDANQQVRLFCPFGSVGNPPPFCTWSRTDNNNVTHQLQIGSRISSAASDNCIIVIFFRDSDNGLYHCTGHNAIGNVTYTFPERFDVESE